MHHIKVEKDPLPLLMDEPLYIVEEPFKKEKSKTLKQLDSSEDEQTNATLPDMPSDLLILVRFHDEEQQIGQYKVFLNKMLAAVRQSLRDSDLIIMNKYPGLKARTIIDQSQCKRVLAFGVDVRDPENFALRHYNGREVVISSPIELLVNSKARKTKLWTLLKSLFSIE